MEQYINLIVLLLFVTILFIFTFYKQKKKPLKDSQKEKIKLRLAKEFSERQKLLNADIDRITPIQIEALIPTLNLSKNILTLFKGECSDEIMKKHFFDKDYSIPYEILYSTKKQQDAYLIDRYKPILAYATEKIFAFDTKLRGFNKYYLETGIQDDEYCFTWDGLFISEILFWWECEIPDNEILYIGNYLGLNYTKEILDSIYKSTNGKGFATGKSLTDWENKMLNQINGIIQ